MPEALHEQGGWPDGVRYDISERYILLYGHLDAYARGVRNGMPLRRGQVIGYVGTTGNAPAHFPHLHFGILRGRPLVSWSEGRPVNPYPLLTPGQLPSDSLPYDRAS